MSTLSYQTLAFLLMPIMKAESFLSPFLRITCPPKSLSFVLFSKRKKKNRDINDLDSWYDDDDDGEEITTKESFWKSKERQQVLNRISSRQDTEFGSFRDINMMQQQEEEQVSSTVSAMKEFQNNLRQDSLAERFQDQSLDRNIEATLIEYERFSVDDNWIDEELQAMYIADNISEEDRQEIEKYDQDRILEEDIRNRKSNDVDENNLSREKLNAQITNDALKIGAEPWDTYGEEFELNENIEEFQDFIMTEEQQQEERLSWEERMKSCQVKSVRLEKARDNPKAKKYFEREPDSLEGCDRMWVCAIDHAAFNCLSGLFKSYGVEFADNFGDFEYYSADDDFYSIEDLATYKARKVFEVTGLPVIASQSSFEIEPISPALSGAPQTTNTQNSRIRSGYYFNNIGDHVDYMIEALKPVSDPSRKTRFRTCLCYYDGEIEFYEYGGLDCDIYWATSFRNFINMNQAIDKMCKMCQMSFGLEYMKWLREAQDAFNFGRGGSQLRDRVLKDGRILPNGNIDISAFMHSMVDINLMDDCGKELSDHFRNMKPTKILTVDTTGLIIAMPIAKYLQIPVVYARKKQSVTGIIDNTKTNTYTANYASTNAKKNEEFLVSRLHLDTQDRVLVIDDILSSGSSHMALLQIIADAGAKAVGLGFLLEKLYASGRVSLAAFSNIPIHSLCQIRSIKDGIIDLHKGD